MVNYSMTSGSLWNYYRDKIDNVNVNDDASDGKSFEYNTKRVGETLERPLQPGNPEKQTITTTYTILIHRSHYSTQISWQFLEISWFTFHELWSRTWIIMDKRLRFYKTS